MAVISSKDTNPGHAVYKRYKNNTNENWMHDAGLRKLNIGIGFMFASAAANGYVLFVSILLSKHSKSLPDSTEVL